MYSMNLGDPQILKAPWLLHFADLQRFSLQPILNATKSKICVEPPTEKHKTCCGWGVRARWNAQRKAICYIIYQSRWTKQDRLIYSGCTQTKVTHVFFFFSDTADSFYINHLWCVACESTDQAADIQLDYHTTHHHTNGKDERMSSLPQH